MLDAADDDLTSVHLPDDIRMRLSRGLLKAFDDGRLTSRSGQALTLEVVREALCATPSELQLVAEDLVKRGCLRRADIGAGTYERTEDGRLGVCSPLDVTLYTRPGCHLCDEAKSQIAPLLRRAGLTLREIDIDADDVLRARYNVDVPVIFLGARKVAKHRVDLEQFRRQLEEARRAARTTGG